MKHDFTLKAEYIELNKALKFFWIWDSGGHVKMIINEGLVEVNGEEEFRIRRKLVAGDVVTYQDNTVTISAKK